MSACDLSSKIKESNKNIYSAQVSKVILITIENSANFQNEEKIFKHFSCKKIPKISIEDYIIRMQKYLNFDQSTLMLSLIYLDRFCEINSFILKLNNFHRLFLISLIIAIKYNEDIHYENTFFAKIGGIPLEELNSIESMFLKYINFSLYVNDILYDIYVKKFNDLQKPLCHNRLKDL